MAENSMKPRIRFKGFTDAWEQRKVGELLIERNEQTPKSDEYPLMAFIANEGVAPKGERYDRSSLINDTENKLYKRTEYGDFIYSSNNLETGSIGVNKYGNATISPVYSIFYTTELADSDFIGRRLIRKDFINEMVKWRQGVIYGQWRIHEDDFVKIKICVPKTCEQRKIGAILDNLDNLITLHQRKYDKIVNIKKALLEKMFPAEGEEVPKIRFKGFTEAWEQRELGEVGDTYAGLSGKSKEDFGHGEAEFVPYMNVFTNPIADVTMTEAIEIDDRQAKVKNGDVLFTTSSETPEEVGMSSVWLKNGSNTYLNSFCFGFRPSESINSFYLAYMLRSSGVRRKIVFLAQGISRYNISKKKMMEIKVPMPICAEQRQLGEIFRLLDNLITLHQRQLEKLKNIKAALLEKMFV